MNLLGVGAYLPALAVAIAVMAAGCSPSVERFKGSPRLVELEDQPPPNVFQSYAPAAPGRPLTQGEVAALQRELLALSKARDRTIDEGERRALEQRMAALRRTAAGAAGRAERGIEGGGAGS